MNFQLRIKRTLILSYTFVTVAACVAVASNFESATRHLLRNLTVLDLVERFSSPSIDGNWGSTVDRVAEHSLLSPDDSRMQVWKQWLWEREQLLVEAEANRDLFGRIEPGKMSLTQDDTTACDETIQTLAVCLASVIRRYDQGDVASARSGFESLWQESLKRNALVQPQQIGRWVLEGYDSRPLSVGRNVDSWLTLFWRSVDNNAQGRVRIDSESGIYAFDDKAVQVLESRNLLSTGDMEYSPMEREFALQNPWQLYPAFLPDPNDVVQVQENEDLPGFSLQFSPDGDDLLVTFLPLETEVPYLMVGEFKTSAPGVFMMMENVNGKNQYPAWLDVDASSDWQRYGAVFEVNASSFSPGLYWGVKHGETGLIEADELGVFQITLPE